jgi:glycogen debranching enzyme
MDVQPLLHELLFAAAAPTQAWSAADGQIRAHGAQGIFHGDHRVLSQALLVVNGVEPSSIAAGATGPGAVEAQSLVRSVESPTPDPAIRLRRRRAVEAGHVEETIVLENGLAHPVELEVSLLLSCDLAAMDTVKAGRVTPAREGTWDGEQIVWRDDAGYPLVRISSPNAVIVDLSDSRAPRLVWTVHVPAVGSAVLTWDLAAHERHGAARPAVCAPPVGTTWSWPSIVSADRRLSALVTRALADLSTLRMSTPERPEDVFLAAGAPWFFTLFGRDSIWAARMLLPLGTELAAGTLRTLADRQGVRVDAATAEQPGKILHEVRSEPFDLGDRAKGRSLPPTYFGTVDATPLWICLLHDAWRWGMPASEVEELLPALQAALAWMADHGDADGDGFLDYHNDHGGLSNQGWKDSDDSVQWRDGTQATGPIALCEVQGYAYEAAIAGAALLDAFGLAGGSGWRTWAAELAVRFRAAFWVSDDIGHYPAIALDAAKRPVDSLTSNIGHLLGTGLLTPTEEALVADRLGRSDLDSGYGLRTLSSTSSGYGPLRYHGGSVWAHDTAIAIAGLAKSGHTAIAAQLLEGVLAAGEEFDYRLPELHAGDARGTAPTTVPYPAACRPQAWSAASAIVLLGVVIGLTPDVPGGTFRLRPMEPSPVGAVTVVGLRLAGHDVTVAVDAHGKNVQVSTTAPLRLLADERVLAGPDHHRPVS